MILMNENTKFNIKAITKTLKSNIPICTILDIYFPYLFYKEILLFKMDNILSNSSFMISLL